MVRNFLIERGKRPELGRKHCSAKAALYLLVAFLASRLWSGRELFLLLVAGAFTAARGAVAPGETELPWLCASKTTL
jgi:hypothetical protein